MSVYETPEYKAFRAARHTWVTKLREYVRDAVRARHPNATGLILSENFDEDLDCSISVESVKTATGEEDLDPELYDELWTALNDLHTLDHPVTLFDQNELGTYELDHEG